MMAFIETLYMYPLCLVHSTVMLLLGVAFVIPALVLHLLVHGGKFDTSYPSLFDFLASVPFGSRLFSSLIGVVAPYSASISATVTSLSATSCSSSLTERPWLRNPFESVHAVALTNLGELTSGLAVLSSMQSTNKALKEGEKKGKTKPPKVRGIVTAIRTVYHKKARGEIFATCDVKGIGQELLAAAGKSAETIDLEAKCVMTDKKGEVVAECFCNWKCQIVKSKAE